MRVVITGASGFIGRPLSLKLADLGYEVLAISRVVPTWSEKSKIFWLEADLSSPLSYQKKIKSFRPEVVIHLAWQDIPDFSFEKSVIQLKPDSMGLVHLLISLPYKQYFISILSISLDAKPQGVTFCLIHLCWRGK